MKQIVIMPGGFHPFHAGHAALYQSAVKAFPNAEVYVAATNDTKTRPFPFSIKEKLAKLAGVAPGHFIQVKSPFKSEEITSHYNSNEDVLIFVRSEKDRTEQPKPGGTKKDGSPAYFQPWTGENLQPFSKHAYIAYLPTVEFGPGIKSATEIRNAWPKLDDRRKTAMVMSLYPVTQTNPKLAANVVKMLDIGMGEPQGVAENDLDRFKKYTRPVVKTTPKIEKTTNPAGRTTDHIEWKVTTPTGEIYRYKSKKQAQEHFDSFGQQGVAEGLSEARNSLFAFVKQQFPTWPDYVLKDFLYQQAKGIRDQAELDDFLKRNKQDFGNCKWTLTKLPITFDIFTPKTQRMLASREGGSSNPFQVPRDAERHAQQSQMIQQKGVSAEPIIVAKLANGYDLIEGWHRTIQHLKAFPQGYTGPAWVCTGATYKSDSVEQGVAEARTNPEQNRKSGSGKYDLINYAEDNISDQDNWAVSMTVEPKLGINPQVGISEDTPKGIYFYPLRYFMQMTERKESLPWGDNMPYMQLFQYDRSGEMTQQTQVDPDQLHQALRQYCPEEIIQQVIDEPDSLYDNTPYWFIYDCLSRLGKGDETNIVRWNKVLRDLGFTSVFDPGRGWIAIGEPTQGVILDPRIIKQHKMFSNRNPTLQYRRYDMQGLADAIRWNNDYQYNLQRQRLYNHPDQKKVRLAVANSMLRPFLGKTDKEAAAMGYEQALKAAADKVIEILKASQ